MSGLNEFSPDSIAAGDRISAFVKPAGLPQAVTMVAYEIPRKTPGVVMEHWWAAF
jgi:hypothetical protein